MQNLELHRNSLLKTVTGQLPPLGSGRETRLLTWSDPQAPVQSRVVKSSYFTPSSCCSCIVVVAGLQPSLICVQVSCIVE